MAKNIVQEEKCLSGQTNTSAIKVAQGVRETVSQDGAVLLDINQGLCFSLNPVGTRIWRMLKEGRSQDEITDSLEEEFRLPRAQLLGDIRNFLAQLESMKLVGEAEAACEKRGFFSRLVARKRSA